MTKNLTLSEILSKTDELESQFRSLTEEKIMELDPLEDLSSTIEILKDIDRDQLIQILHLTIYTEVANEDQ